MPHLQPQQPQGVHRSCWPQCPPQHATYNPLTEPQYPAMVPTLPQPQFPSPFLAFGDQTAWLQGLVAAISRTIQDDEKNAVVEVVDARKAEISAKDEEALIKVLKKWKAGELKMPQVFEELSKKNGHTKTEWKTLFITNLERLDSKVDLSSNFNRKYGGDTQVAGSSTQWASRTQSTSNFDAIDRPSRYSSAALVNSRTDSREESGSMAEWSSGDTRRSESTSRDRRSYSSPPRCAPQRRVTKNGNLKTAQVYTRVSSRAGKERVPVTHEDLRAMARHLFENGDTREMRRYRSARWREFAERPENRKRSLDAWACIPRLRPKHAAAIERYLKEYKDEARLAAKSTKLEAFSPEIELRGEETMQKRRKAANLESASGGDYCDAPLRGRKASLAVYPRDVVDLTADALE